ncbi:Helix-turn-helix transcriptional regulator [Azospirillaceae bacterium]
MDEQSKNERNVRRRRKRTVREHGPDPIDVHVGSRVRLRRTLLGLSQEKFGEAIDLTFQQVQKYERGANRMGASRLYQASRILDVPVSFFFDQMPEEIAELMPQPILDEMKSDEVHAQKPETQDLVRVYFAIQDPSVRKKVFELVKAVANAEGSDAASSEG